MMTHKETPQVSDESLQAAYSEQMEFLRYYLQVSRESLIALGGLSLGILAFGIDKQNKTIIAIAAVAWITQCVVVVIATKAKAIQARIARRIEKELRIDKYTLWEHESTPKWWRKNTRDSGPTHIDILCDPIIVITLVLSLSLVAGLIWVWPTLN